MAYVIELDGKLYGYGRTRDEALNDYRGQTIGAPAGWRRSMNWRATCLPITDDHASDVEEMLAADVLAWI
jgi:hypothetical protein